MTSASVTAGPSSTRMFSSCRRSFPRVADPGRYWVPGHALGPAGAQSSGHEWLHFAARGAAAATRLCHSASAVTLSNTSGRLTSKRRARH
jgi:hypothetical protein